MWRTNALSIHFCPGASPSAWGTAQQERACTCDQVVAVVVVIAESEAVAVAVAVAAARASEVVSEYVLHLRSKDHRRLKECFLQVGGRGVEGDMDRFN